MVYINEYPTQERSALHKLRVIKKDNPAIGSVYTRNLSIYYKLHSDKNKHYTVNQESDLASTKSDKNDASFKELDQKKLPSNSQLRLKSNKYYFD